MAPDGSYASDGTASFDGWSIKASGDAGIVITGRLDEVATPIFGPPSGAPAPTTVSITSATTGAQIRYTTNTRVPTMSEALYSGP